MATEFEPVTENASLKRAIIDAIQRQGGISFRDFMRMALYELRLGYYESSRPKMGREGDYLTSPEVSPVFGAIVGRQLREMWQTMGEPPGFGVVEVGAGTGTLCRDVVRWADRIAPDLAEAMTYTIVEISPAAAERQRALLEDEGPRGNVRWADALPADVEGCILSNELLDAMPVHRTRVEGGRLLEVYVGCDGERFVEELREAAPEVEAYFQDLGLLPGEGCAAEVNLESLRWVRQAAASLRRGFLLTFDYGYEAGELFAPWRTDGTLLCFYRHNASANPYARIGRQDMTSHVDFTSVRRAGEAAGLQTLANVSQTDFLLRLGVSEAMSPGEGQGIEEYYARRSAVIELLDPAGLGRIRVLVQAKGLDPEAAARVKQVLGTA